MTIKVEKHRNLVAKYARRFNKSKAIESKKDRVRRGTEKNYQAKLRRDVTDYIGDHNDI